MLKLIGGILLTGCGTFLGLEGARRLARRVRALEAWEEALARMENELSFRLSGVPELAGRLAGSGREPVRAVFKDLEAALDKLGEKSLGELWSAALRAHGEDMGREELESLEGLGDVLGRYGWEDQCRELERIRRELEERRRKVREELERKGKAYGTLGLALGAFLSILLL